MKQSTAARKSAHRRHQALTEQAARQGKTAKADSADKAKTYQKGIEAYSDTSSVAGVKDSMVQPVTIYHNRTKVESESDPIIQAILNGTLGAGGFLLVIVAILAALLFSLAPLIAFIFLIKYFINRHNKRVELAEKAMEKGVPIPEAAKSLKSESPERREECFNRYRYSYYVCVCEPCRVPRRLWPDVCLLRCGAIGD